MPGASKSAIDTQTRSLEGTIVQAAGAVWQGEVATVARTVASERAPAQAKIVTTLRSAWVVHATALEVGPDASGRAAVEQACADLTKHLRESVDAVERAKAYKSAREQATLDASMAALGELVVAVATWQSGLARLDAVGNESGSASPPIGVSEVEPTAWTRDDQARLEETFAGWLDNFGVSEG